MFSREYHKKSNENWHYDKYKDPYEFPILNLSSDDENDENDDMNNTTSASTSSAHLSKKLPKISDEKFKQILEARKESIRRASNLTPSTVISQQLPNKESKSSIPKAFASTEIHEQNQTDENLLSSSTPKLNNNTTTITNDKSLSPRITAKNSAKNLSPSPLLLHTVDDNEDDDKRDDRLAKLIDTIQAQTLQINNLEIQLNKKNILVSNHESKIELLEHENKTLSTKLNSLQKEVKDVKRYDTTLLDEIATLESDKSELQEKNNQIYETFSNLKTELKKEKILLKKEVDLHKQVLHNYDSKFESLNNERKELQKSLDDIKMEYSQLRKNYDKLQNDYDNLQDKCDQYEVDKKESIAKIKRETEGVVAECEELKFKNSNLLQLKDDNEALSKEHKKLKDDYSKLSVERQELRSRVDLLSSEKTQLTTNQVTLKAELTTKIEVLQSDLVKSKQKCSDLNTENQLLKSEIKSLNDLAEDFKNKTIGDMPVIDESVFKDRYKLLEMDDVDKKSLIELRNIIKNILGAFNIKFSDLKNYIVFIRDDIFVFFNDIHSILHSTKSGNSIIIDKSIKLDVSDKDKMRACMELLIKDAKQLKGIST